MFGADFSDTQFVKSYLIYHGSIEPQYIGGLSNTLKWRDFTFSFFITAQLGRKIRLAPTYDPEFADLNVFSKRYNNRWLNTGDELKTDVPTIPSLDLIRAYGRQNIEIAYNTYNYSQEMVADGSFVRLKNISLQWDCPKSIRKAISPIKSLSLSANVTNPLLIYSDPKLHGQDPEYYLTGGVSMPAPKQLTLSLRLGL